MQLKNFFKIIILFFLPIYINAQVQEEQKYLSADEFISIVRQYHPVVKQANLLIERARQELLATRGSFDPLVYISTDQKTFDGKNYFIYTNPEIKIPTWFGIEVKAGLENNAGDFLNSESTPGKTSYAGIMIPLGKNLLMDKRRAALQQAKIFTQQSDAERLNTVNDLLYDAYAAYWNWVREYQAYKIITNVIAVNEKRLQLMRLGAIEGDRAAMDTVEALTQLQSFQLAQSEALQKFKVAGFELSNYLWLENQTPYVISEKVEPTPAWLNVSINNYNFPVLEELLTNASTNHPQLKIYQFKIQSLQIEQKLKFQNLLPTFNVKGNLLNKGYNVLKGVDVAFLENNYKFGFDLGIPLFLRDGRGQYNAAKIKVKETNWQLKQKQLEIENKIKAYFNEALALQQQIKISESALNNFQRLFRAEETRFNMGESSLFILNSRENKVLEAQQKLLELKTKFFKSIIAIQWAAGVLN